MDTNIPTKKNTPPYAPLSPPLPLSPYGAVALRIASISIYPFPYFILIKQNVLQQRCWCLFLFFLTNIENSNKQTNRVNSLSRTKDRRKSWILPFGGESRVMKRSIFGWKDEGRRTKDVERHGFPFISALPLPHPTHRNVYGNYLPWDCHTDTVFRSRLFPIPKTSGSLSSSFRHWDFWDCLCI